MQIEPTALPGVVILTPRTHGDARGTVFEAWNRASLSRLRIGMEFVQEYQLNSRAPGTIRGLHCQTPPRAQTKLVRVVAGAILDIAVDVRVGSPHFGQWVGVELSARNGRQLLVPAGFLHGFATRTADTIVLQKTSEPNALEAGVSIHVGDPDLGIDWGLDPATAILSDKDARAPRLRDWRSPFTYDGPLPHEISLHRGTRLAGGQ